MGAQIFHRQVAPGMEDHIGHATLAQARVRLADHRCRLDEGMAVEHLLDLDHRHVLTAANDDVLRPPGYPDIAISVDPGQIARIEPAILRHVI